MTKQRRSKLPVSRKGKQNQGQRVSNLQMPPQSKLISKNKKKTLINQSSISNSTMHRSSSITPTFHQETQIISNFFPQIQISQTQAMFSSINIYEGIHKRSYRDYFFGQIQHELQRKGQRSQQLESLSDYVNNIGEHLFENESKFPMPNLQYSTYRFFSQAERQKGMQLIYSFCLNYRFKTDTTFLALNIYHRLSFDKQFDIYSNMLKAISSLFVAAKYQQIAIPKLQSFAKVISHQVIQTKDILKVESHILMHFGFSLGFTTPIQFVELLVIRYNLDESLKNQMIQLCYISLSSLALLQEKGSLLALSLLIMLKPDVQIDLVGNDYLRHEIGWRIQQMRKLSFFK